MSADADGRRTIQGGMFNGTAPMDTRFCVGALCPAPDEMRGRFDIDREDIIARIFLALLPRSTSPRCSTYFIVHIGPELSGRGRIERTTGKICRY